MHRKIIHLLRIYEWEQRKLGEIAEIKTGPFGSTLHAEDYVQSGIPIITTEHFKNGHLPENKNGTPQVSDEDYARLKSYVLKEGDIVFSRVGSVDINALVTTLQDGWLFSGRVLRVRSQNQFDSDYLHYLLDTLTVRNDIISRAVGQTMPSINTEILKTTKLVLSRNIAEQRLIASALRKLDDTLALHQRKLTLLEQLKQTYLQAIFPQNEKNIPALRFASFSEPWEQRKVGEYLKESRIPGTDGSVAKKLTVKLWRKGVIPKEESYQGSAATNYFIRKSGQFIYGKLDFLNQAFGIVPYHLDGYESTLDSPAFDIFPTMNSIFFLEYVSRKEFYLYQGTLANGSRKAKRIHVETFFEMPINVPSNEEQNKIGNFLKQFDDTIALHQSKLERLTDLKQVLLAKMFVWRD